MKIDKHPSGRPVRRDQKKSRIQVWNVPNYGSVLPRFQTQNPSRPLADAIGFHQIPRYDFEGSWAKRK